MRGTRTPVFIYPLPCSRVQSQGLTVRLSLLRLRVQVDPKTFNTGHSRAERSQHKRSPPPHPPPPRPRPPPPQAQHPGPPAGAAGTAYSTETVRSVLQMMSTLSPTFT